MKKYDWRHPVRAVSVRAINLVPTDATFQLDAFTDTKIIERAETIDRTVEALRHRFGENIIKNACLFVNPKMATDERINVF